MPGLYKDEAIVLKTIKLGEADRIVTLLTRTHGKVRAVAKGVRRTKSRFGARLEPFTQVDLLIYRGRNLDTITSAHIIEPFAGIRGDYGRLTAATALVEFVEKITPDQERNTPTYSLLLGGLEAVANGGGTTVVPAFLLKLLSVSGYHPQLRVCAGCGRVDGLSGFSAALGGAVCDACWRDDRDAVRLTGDRIALLSLLLASDFGHPADAEAVVEVTHVLKSYAEYHLESPLRSIRYLTTN